MCSYVHIMCVRRSSQSKLRDTPSVLWGMPLRGPCRWVGPGEEVYECWERAWRVLVGLYIDPLFLRSHYLPGWTWPWSVHILSLAPPGLATLMKSRSCLWSDLGHLPQEPLMHSLACFGPPPLCSDNSALSLVTNCCCAVLTSTMQQHY